MEMNKDEQKRNRLKKEEEGKASVLVWHLETAVCMEHTHTHTHTLIIKLYKLYDTLTTYEDYYYYFFFLVIQSI